VGASKTARKSMADAPATHALPAGAYWVQCVRGQCPECGGRFRMGVAPDATAAAVCAGCFRRRP